MNEGSNLHSFVMHSKLHFYLWSFTATPTSMCAHEHFYNLNVWLIMWPCSWNVEAVLLAAFVLFLSPMVSNLYKSTGRNHTSSRYKATILLWRLSIANQSKANIDKNMCEPSNLHSFCWHSFKGCFPTFVPVGIISDIYTTKHYMI